MKEKFNMVENKERLCTEITLNKIEHSFPPTSPKNLYEDLFLFEELSEINVEIVKYELRESSNPKTKTISFLRVFFSLKYLTHSLITFVDFEVHTTRIIKDTRYQISSNSPTAINPDRKRRLFEKMIENFQIPIDPKTRRIKLKDLIGKKSICLVSHAFKDAIIKLMHIDTNIRNNVKNKDDSSLEDFYKGAPELSPFGRPYNGSDWKKRES